MLLRKLFTTYGHQTASVLIALAALGALLMLAWVAQRPARRAIRRIERAWTRVSRRRSAWAIPAVVGVVALMVHLSLVGYAGAPVPRVHDEFSYLLAADTFARGRVTNPPHPMWRHFETIHVLWQPTYASKFPPAQGVALAVGQVTLGAPWFGAVLATALGCAAVAWALLGATRGRWALLGGLLIAVHPQVLEWSHSYWGGGVGMIGGALVLGALVRIVRGRAVAPNAALLAAGGAILAATRPYEATVWAILAAATLLVWLATMRHAKRAITPLVAQTTAPALAVLLPVVALLGYYNFRVTGDALRFPYLLHAQTYMLAPLTFWESEPGPKRFNNPQLRDQHVGERRYFDQQRSLRGWVVENIVKAYDFARQHLLRNPALLAGLLAIPLALRAQPPAALLALAYAFGFIAAYAAVPWFVHHYPGAAMGVLLLLGTFGLRSIRAWRPRGGRRAGQTFVWLTLVCVVPMGIVTLVSERRANRAGWAGERQRIVDRLHATPGQHLVLVRYQPDHPVGEEWVYNAADIDAAKVVWARCLSPAQDRELLNYFRARQPWIAHADERPPRLELIDHVALRANSRELERDPRFHFLPFLLLTHSSGDSYFDRDDAGAGLLYSLPLPRRTEHHLTRKSRRGSG